MNVLYRYILDSWKEGECCGWLNRNKENEDVANPSLYAFRFPHHIYMPIKRETNKGLLPNKNRV